MWWWKIWLLDVQPMVWLRSNFEVPTRSRLHWSGWVKHGETMHNVANHLEPFGYVITRVPQKSEAICQHLTVDFSHRKSSYGFAIFGTHHVFVAHHSTWKQSSSRSLSTAGQLGIISANVRVGLNGAMVHWGYHRAAMVEVPSRYHGRAKVLAEKSEAGPRTCVHREPWSAQNVSRWNHIRLCPPKQKTGITGYL